MGKFSKTRRVWPGVVLAVVLVAAALGWYCYFRRAEPVQTAPEPTLSLSPDPAAQVGTPQADQVTRPLESNSFRVVINQMLTMETGESPCNILAENPEENPYDLRVSLYLKESGEFLGATHRILRGQRVEEIDLEQALPAGSYPVLAKLELFDDNQEPAGEMTLELSLLVRK